MGLLFASSAKAIIVSGNNPDAAINSGIAYTGVVRVYTQDSFCTGALFGPSRIYVLTAAHCLVDSNGNSIVNAASYVGIDGASSGVADPIVNAYVAPEYIGAGNSYANDIAVVQLQQAAPLDAATYSLYTSTDELGKDVILVGHGLGGTGATGPQAGYEQSADLRGRRMGTNTYDVLASALCNGNPSCEDSTHILWDFDNGTNAQNALALAGSSTGDGATEVSIAGGDSGGPSFYNGMIIGVHSYTTCFSSNGYSCSSPPDIDTTLNDTFGELGADTRVSLYTGTNGFLSPFANSVPEPATWVLMGAALVGIGLRSRVRRS